MSSFARYNVIDIILLISLSDFLYSHRNLVILVKSKKSNHYSSTKNLSKEKKKREEELPWLGRG